MHMHMRASSRDSDGVYMYIYIVGWNCNLNWIINKVWWCPFGKEYHDDLRRAADGKFDYRSGQLNFGRASGDC